MSCIVSGKVVTATAAGSTTAQDGKFVYLLPSRTDFQYSQDGGTTWQAWEGDPDLSGGLAGAIKATTNSTGDWSLTLPFTDDPTEIQLPVGASSPALYWNIIDPNPATGTVYYKGQTPATVVGAAATIKDLIALPSPDTWTVTGVAFSGYPVGNRRYAVATFTSPSNVAAVTFADIGTAAWRFNYGIETNDSGGTFYSVTVDSALKTSAGGTVYLSDVPPAGVTVTVPIEVYV